jgi:DNA-binding transcriptional LysR family regulator
MLPSHFHSTLDQWRVLQTVVEAGGYARAAEILHRSQSSLSYSTAQLQERLGVQLLRTEGRRAVLTAAGAVLLAEARVLLEGLGSLEMLAGTLSNGLEPRVRLAVESVFPKPLLFEALDNFRQRPEATYVELREGGRQDVDLALTQAQGDLCIGLSIPSGYLGDHLLDIELIAVAAASHPLQRLGRLLTRDDLAGEVFVAMEDATLPSASSRPWLLTNRRWSMNTVESAINAVCHGMGFAWLPRHRILDELQRGELKPLELKTGRVRMVSLFLVEANARPQGPSAQRLSEEILNVCAGARRDET